MTAKQRRRKQNKEMRQRNMRLALGGLVFAADATNTEVLLAVPASITPAVAAADGQPARLPAVQLNAYNGGPMSVPGYPHPVVVDLQGAIDVGSVKLLRDHDPSRIVGHGSATIDGNSLNASGVVSGTSEDAREVVSSAGNGFPWEASIGLRPSRLEYVQSGQSATVNGQSVKGPAYIVRAGKLKEISLVALGADETTSASVAAIDGGSGTMTFEAWIKAKGWEIARCLGVPAVVALGDASNYNYASGRLDLQSFNQMAVERTQVLEREFLELRIRELGSQEVAPSQNNTNSANDNSANEEDTADDSQTAAA